ncbi:MAG: glutathione peroxidase [Bermanella sp.]|jgi:glutathione peroxidase
MGWLMKIFVLLALIGAQSLAFADCPPLLDSQIDKLHSSDVIELCDAVNNKPVLIVNTASHCGYTKQFKGLEAVHQKYKDQGLLVIGFPSNSFNQEADNEAATADVCYRNFGVSFMMSKPINIKGNNAHPIFKHLASKQGEPEWNFNKYLVDAKGNVIKRYDSWIKPTSKTLEKDIEAVL